MAKQRERRRSSPALAEQSTLPVELDAAERAPAAAGRDPSGDSPRGSVISRRVRPRIPTAASLAIDDGTEAGALAGLEPTHALEPAPVLSGRVEEPTQSFGPGEIKADDLIARTPLLDDDPAGLALFPGDVIAGRYRIERQIEDIDGMHLWAAVDIDDRLVWVRNYRDPEQVRQRKAWRSLVDAFAAGAALPELLTLSGVVLLLDLVDDERFGPVIVTERFDGGTLAEHAESLSGDQLCTCFENIAAVLSQAHAQGVALGRLTPQDIIFDSRGVPHLDLSVAAFADALDVRGPSIAGPPEGGPPSPAGDVWWLGRTLRACLPASARDSTDAALQKISEICTQGANRPSMIDIYHRFENGRIHSALGPSKAPALMLLMLGIFLALGAGWVAGGGLGSSEVSVPLQPDPRLQQIENARAAANQGDWLRAGQIYQRLLADGSEPEVHEAWKQLKQTRAYRRALKALKKRLAAAAEVTPALRRDVEILQVLQPKSLVLEHWLDRLAEDPGEK
ncbi:MAG: hypothetical protein AAF449_01230 [Myxococcota bacterium]